MGGRTRRRQPDTHPPWADTSRTDFLRVSHFLRNYHSHFYCNLDRFQTKYYFFKNMSFRFLKLMISNNRVITGEAAREVEASCRQSTGGQRQGSDGAVDAVLSSKSDRGIPSLIKTVLLFPRRPLLRRTLIINNALNKTTSQIVAHYASSGTTMNIGLCCVM